MVEIFRKVRFILTREEKFFFLSLYIYSIFISLVELVSVSAIVPFLSMINDSAVLDENKYLNYFFVKTNLISKEKFIIFFGALLIGFYILRASANMFYQYLLARFSQEQSQNFKIRLFKNYLSVEFQEFAKKNSSTLIKTLTSEADQVVHFLISLLNVMSETILIFLIYTLMLFVDWKITVLVSLFLAIQALIIMRLIQDRVKEEGEKRVYFSDRLYELFSTSFSNFKMLKLIPTNDKILNDLSRVTQALTRANILNISLNSYPRIILEAIGFVIIISIVLYYLWKDPSNSSKIIPTVTMFVLALYRLLPSVSRIISSVSSLIFLRKSIDVIHKDLSERGEELGDGNLNFKKCIKLKSISFSYDGTTPILKDINLEITKGEKIAFIGESGAGKSTLVDIIIGLFRPNNGNILLDDVVVDESNILSLRNKIGYIPQSVYLFDGTVEDNVVFGREYDRERLVNVLKKSKIWDILAKKNGLETRVGDAGIQLSGGQKQRIAIARALYGDPDILILDEATSALDNKVESEIMEEFYQLSTDKTLIIVAHRLSTIKNCNKVYTVENGSLFLKDVQY